MKGGGDAVSAPRAVIQTGEFDYAWNMQVEDEILKRLEQGGKGKADIVPAATSSTSSATTPIRGKRWTASAPASRRRIRCLTDPGRAPGAQPARGPRSVQEQIYGRTGIATANFLNARAFASKNTKWEFNVDKAARSSRRPAGRRAPTASAPRTARS
jgi:peptide/nickel transport system substrate-binding protein